MRTQEILRCQTEVSGSVRALPIGSRGVLFTAYVSHVFICFVPRSTVLRWTDCSSFLPFPLHSISARIVSVSAGPHARSRVHSCRGASFASSFGSCLRRLHPFSSRIPVDPLPSATLTTSFCPTTALTSRDDKMKPRHSRTLMVCTRSFCFLRYLSSADGVHVLRSRSATLPTPNFRSGLS